MIVWRTVMKEIPSDCAHCACFACTLPLNKNGDAVLKKYTTRRHPCCPLLKIEEGVKENV